MPAGVMVVVIVDGKRTAANIYIREVGIAGGMGGVAAVVVVAVVAVEMVVVVV